MAINWSDLCNFYSEVFCLFVVVFFVLFFFSIFVVENNFYFSLLNLNI